jgi:hypothetical protein
MNAAVIPDSDVTAGKVPITGATNEPPVEFAQSATPVISRDFWMAQSAKHETLATAARTTETARQPLLL